VRTELAAILQRREDARTNADLEAQRAAAAVAALARNRAIEEGIEAERRFVHAGSIAYGPHRWTYHKGESNELKIKKKHSYTCGCGFYQYGGDNPTGQCPSNPYHTQPTWEAWLAQAKADGTWNAALAERGYDFNVVA
jgi:hypothetical protein